MLLCHVCIVRTLLPYPPTGLSCRSWSTRSRHTHFDCCDFVDLVDAGDLLPLESALQAADIMERVGAWERMLSAKGRSPVLKPSSTPVGGVVRLDQTIRIRLRVMSRGSVEARSYISILSTALGGISRLHEIHADHPAVQPQAGFPCRRFLNVSN